MKRDMDLVRDLLLKIEDANGPSMCSLLPNGAGEDEIQRYGYHTKILVDSGFLTGVDASSMTIPDWMDLQLTWQGQEFLDTLRDQTVWERTKKLARAAGGGSFQILIEIGKALVVEAAKQHLGKL